MSPRKTKVEPEVKPEPTHEEIELRAYEIHESGDGGDEFENWYRAEQELSDRYAGVT
jgi:hypothetical protein